MVCESRASLGCTSERLKNRQIFPECVLSTEVDSCTHGFTYIFLVDVRNLLYPEEPRPPTSNRPEGGKKLFKVFR